MSLGKNSRCHKTFGKRVNSSSESDSLGSDTDWIESEEGKACINQDDDKEEKQSPNFEKVRETKDIPDDEEANDRQISSLSPTPSEAVDRFLNLERRKKRMVEKKELLEDEMNGDHQLLLDKIKELDDLKKQKIRIIREGDVIYDRVKARKRKLEKVDSSIRGLEGNLKELGKRKRFSLEEVVQITHQKSINPEDLESLQCPLCRNKLVSVHHVALMKGNIAIPCLYPVCMECFADIVKNGHICPHCSKSDGFWRKIK